MNIRRLGQTGSLLALAVAVGGLLRLLSLGYKSLWLDEVATYRIAESSFADILSMRWDPHPPLYYLFLHFWSGLGHSEVMLRLPSALAGIAAIPLLYAVIRAWGGQWSSGAAAGLLALAPLHVWYSQETRMYAIVCALGLLSTYFYVLATRRGRSLAWLGWGLATLAGLYTDYSMALVVAVQATFYPFCLSASRVRDRMGRAGGTPAVTAGRAFWAGPLALLAIVVCYLPQARIFLIPTLAGRAGGSLQIFFLPARLLTDLGLPVTIAQLHGAVAGMACVAAVLAAALALWVLPARPWRRWRAERYLPAVAVGIYALILVASAISRAWGLKRQLLVLLPYVLAAVAAAVASHPQRTRIALVLAALTLPFTGYALFGQEMEDWRAVAQTVAAGGQPGDTITFHESYNQQAFDYYYHGSLPEVGVGPSDVPGGLTKLMQTGGRVWLVLASDQFNDPEGAVAGWFAAHMTLQQEHDYSRVRVRLYAPR